MSLPSLARAGTRVSTRFSSRCAGVPATANLFSIRGAGVPAPTYSIRGAGGQARFCTSTRKEFFSEKRYKELREKLIGASALVGAISTLGGGIYALGSLAIKYLENAQKANLSALRAEISALNEALLESIKQETSCREDFQKKATYAHQDLIRRTDLMNSDLRADMVKLQRKSLEFEQGAVFYRDQVLKAEEAVKKSGGLKREADQYLHLVQKISELEAKVENYTSGSSVSEEVKGVTSPILSKVDAMNDDIMNLKVYLASLQGTGGSA